jgi:hypothetical protein
MQKHKQGVRTACRCAGPSNSGHTRRQALTSGKEGFKIASLTPYLFRASRLALQLPVRGLGARVLRAKGGQLLRQRPQPVQLLAQQALCVRWISTQHKWREQRMRARSESPKQQLAQRQA